MNFYLDTNALYHLKKVPNSVIGQGFTSVLSLIELVSGMNNDNYSTRRSILKNISDAKLIVDCSFPQAIVMNSFDVFDDYEFEDIREEWLTSAVRLAVKTDSFEEFSKLKLEGSEHTFEYFRGLDNFLSDSFIKAVAQAYKIIQMGEDSEITIDGKTYKLNSWENLKHFFSEQVNINRNLTVNALTSIALRVPGFSFTREEVYSSYNGLIDIYVQCFSRYCLNRASRGQMPSRNDFQDLTHLLYLKNNFGLKIVSDDKIYKKYLPEQCVSIADLLAL